MQLLRKILFPFSLLYGFVVYLRNYLFDVGVFKSKSFSTPTICVGNLSAGGTGKTPMIEFLIYALQDKYRVAVLSRGYGRKSKGFLLANNNSTVEQLGDEPYQIYNKFTGIVLAVDADRRNGLVVLEKEVKPDIILLDDAFQHRKVKPTFNILLTSYDNLYVKDWYLPAGNLRDAKNQSKRAHIIIVTKCPDAINENDQKIVEKQLKIEKGQELFFSKLVYENELKGNKQMLTLKEIKGKTVTLVTGIANPKPLISFLQNKHIVVEHLQFKDHHFFTEAEIEKINSKQLVITTEKDYVRLKGKVCNMFYVEVKHKILNNGKSTLLKSVEDKIG